MTCPGKWLLASAALHLLAAAGMALLCASAQKPATVIDLAQLGHAWHEPEAAGSEGSQQEPPAPEPMRQKQAPKISKPQKSKLAARTRPSAESVRPAPSQALADDGPGDNASTAIAAGGTGAGDSGTGKAIGGSVTGGQAGAYRGRYFGFITELVQKAVVYPLQARRMGWQGTVTVSFIIRPDGRITHAAVLAGSGHGVLDASALRAVKKLGRLPRSLQPVEIRLPVSFRLTEKNSF